MNKQTPYDMHYYHRARAEMAQLSDFKDWCINNEELLREKMGREPTYRELELAYADANSDIEIERKASV